MNTTKPTNASPDEVQAVLSALEDVDRKMEFLTPLNPEQRGEFRGRKRLSSKGWRLLHGRVDAARNHRDLLPPTFDLRQLERAVEVALGLQSCLACLDKMSQGISDTLLMLGARAGEAGAVAYQYIKVATSTQQHTVGTLAKRPARSRRPTTVASAVPTAPAPTLAPKASEPAPSTSPVTPKQDAA